MVDCPPECSSEERNQSVNSQNQELLNLILGVSFEHREVTLASGRKSNFYLDLRKTLMLPKGIRLAGEAMLCQLRNGCAVDAIGGMAVGAVPLVSAILGAIAADETHLCEDVLGFFVSKQKKEHGLGRQIEGCFKPGQRVALVEDTTTTGGSTLEALDAVTAAGGKVTRVLCLVDRGEGATEAFAERGIPLESIFKRKDLPV